MCKFHTPLGMGRVRVIISCQKRQTNFLTPYTGVCGFFLQLNLLPPYSLRSQGDKHIDSQGNGETQWYMLWHGYTTMPTWVFKLSTLFIDLGIKPLPR